MEFAFLTQHLIFTGTVHDPKLLHFFLDKKASKKTVTKKTSKKCDNLRKFTQNVLFMYDNKTKQKGKKCENLGCGNMGSWTIFGN